MEVQMSEITRHFETGAVRGEDRGRGKPSLLPFEIVSMVIRCFEPVCYPLIGLIELSKIYEAGSKKYDARNWEKGIPISAYVDSAHRHIAKWQRGDTDEPHLAQYTWNVACLLQTHLWAIDGTVYVGGDSPYPDLLDIPLVKRVADSLRDVPLPKITRCAASHHFNMTLGSLWGYLYGKHPINLAGSFANALCLLESYTNQDQYYDISILPPQR